jgi:hypothetical protein
MARFGINDLLGPDHSFRSVEEAIQALGRKARPGSAQGGSQGSSQGSPKG